MDDTTHPWHHRPVGGLLVGLAGAVLGLLPWLLHGARLPLQNLWSPFDLQELGTPVALLPLSQYALALLAAVPVVGAAALGAALRWSDRRAARATPLRWILVGFLGALLLALVQSVAAVPSRPLASGRTTELVVYLAVLVVWVLTATAIGVAVLVGLRSSRPGRVLVATGVAAALALPTWLTAFAPAPPGSPPTAPAPVTLLIAAVALGLVLALHGRSVSGTVPTRIVVAVAAPVAAGLLAAVCSAASSRALLRSPVDLVEFAGLVFLTDVRSLGPTVQATALTVAVTAVGLTVRAAVDRTRRREPDSGG